MILIVYFQANNDERQFSMLIHTDIRFRYLSGVGTQRIKDVIFAIERVWRLQQLLLLPPQMCSHAPSCKCQKRMDSSYEFLTMDNKIELQLDKFDFFKVDKNFVQILTAPLCEYHSALSVAITNRISLGNFIVRIFPDVLIFCFCNFGIFIALPFPWWRDVHDIW